MSDLISRSSLAKDVFRRAELMPEQKELFDFFRFLIYDQPTAYDVGKVVEQIRPLSFVNEYPGLDNKNNRVVGLDDVIEIVKSGGIE